MQTIAAALEKRCVQPIRLAAMRALPVSASNVGAQTPCFMGLPYGQMLA
jgi:hypothetical protein